MELYIRIRDNQIIDHPILKENLLEAYPDIDLATTTEFIPFERIPAPVLGPYDKSASNYYTIVDGVARDTWVVDTMTAEERLEKQNQVKLQWQQNGFPSWIFNEEKCYFEPPVAYPEDGNQYRWDEASQSWILFA